MRGKRDSAILKSLSSKDEQFEEHFIFCRKTAYMNVHVYMYLYICMETSSIRLAMVCKMSGDLKDGDQSP